MNKILRKLALGAAAISSCLMLAACAKKPAPAVYRPYDLHPAVHQALVNQLQNEGVNVIQQGDKLSLVLSADQFFDGTSTTVNASCYQILGQIAVLIQSYDHAPIKIIGYTDNVYTRAGRKTLSVQLANVVYSYMWAKGIQAQRMIYGGLGSQNAVSSNATPAGAADNRRVEILVGLAR